MNSVPIATPVTYERFLETVHPDDRQSVAMAWAAALTGEQTDSTVAYKDTKGHAYTSVLWQIVLHVVNHGSHHRGQVSGFLRAMGHPPPALDLGLYYREIRNG